MNSEKEKIVAQNIRSQYEEQGESKLDKLKKIDRKAKRPSAIFAYTFGIIGALVLGLGMCFAMGVIGNLLPLGIVIGCVGIAMVSINYLLYKKIEARQKKKYSSQILELTDELL